MFELGLHERSELLGLARRVLVYFFQARSVLEYQPQFPALTMTAGAFVSLYQGEHLRGCIGHLTSERALYRNVMESALSAAFDDPRFLPLQADELFEVQIEISVLSSSSLVQHPAEIEAGKHGLIISMGGRRGLLLPQVAAKYGWDASRFLQETCFKAGLPRNAWCQGATVEKFLAQVFSE